MIAYTGLSDKTRIVHLDKTRTEYDFCSCFFMPCRPDCACMSQPPTGTGTKEGQLKTGLLHAPTRAKTVTTPGLNSYHQGSEWLLPHTVVVTTWGGVGNHSGSQW